MYETIWVDLTEDVPRERTEMLKSKELEQLLELECMGVVSIQDYEEI